MPKLLLKFNAAVIKEFVLNKPALVVGRKPESDIVVDNPAVSGFHCKISLQGDTYFVEDMNSTNGTYLNDKRIVKSGLRHNDVIGLATKHALVFVDEVAAADGAPVTHPAGTSEATMVLSAEKQEEMAKASIASAAVGSAETVGRLKILKGAMGPEEYVLNSLSTYIGKSDRAQIPIKGKGLFGSAPEVAASIHRRPDGYVLMAIKDGYPVINGRRVSGQTTLNDGDIIDCGATTMQFFLKEK